MEYSPKTKFDYECHGEHHVYYPDFLIAGKLYEVKGDYFFKVDESTGKEVMVCPYRHKSWTDEKYRHMCEIYEAKHQCMLANSITILRWKEINNLKEVFGHGGA